MVSINMTLLFNVRDPPPLSRPLFTLHLLIVVHLQSIAGPCQPTRLSYRSFSFSFVSMHEDLAEAVNPLRLMHVSGTCVSGLSAAAAADCGQDVVRTSGCWTRSQTTARCWSSSLWSERSYIHRYVGPNWPPLK